MCQLPDGFLTGKLIVLLVQDSTELYRCLLAQDRLRQHHLAPLAGRPPDAVWADLARLALEAGKEPRAIAEVAFYGGQGRSGFGIEHWGQWETAFRMLLETAQGNLKDVAHHGLQIARNRISDAKREKRRFELTGEF